MLEFLEQGFDHAHGTVPIASNGAVFEGEVHERGYRLVGPPGRRLESRSFPLPNTRYPALTGDRRTGDFFWKRKGKRETAIPGSERHKDLLLPPS